MKGLAPRVLGYLRPHRLELAGALGQVLLISACELAKPWPLKIAIDCGDFQRAYGEFFELRKAYEMYADVVFVNALLSFFLKKSIVRVHESSAAASS